MANTRRSSLSLFCLVFIAALMYKCDGGFCANKEDCKWFGTRNQFLCHCKELETTQCDRETGACPNDECAEGWFGPACLYRSAEIVGGPSCKEEDNNQKLNLTISIKKPQKLTWLRLTMLQDVSKEELLGFLFDYESVSSKVQEATGSSMVLDSKTVDYSIPVQELVKSIVIKGEGVGSLCSVDISNGWNVAIGEPQVDGSNIKFGWKASNSVDGGYATTGDDSQKHGLTCVHINENMGEGVTQGPPVFMMNFSIPVRISEAKIYNRLDDDFENRLNGFTFDVYDNKTNRLYTYTDDHEKSDKEEIFTIPIDTDEPVHALTFELPKKEDIINFCEVEAYGEKICGQNKFGFMCEKECHCFGGVPCFFPSGICPDECAPGWQNETCSIECWNGTYGISCLSLCSTGCVNSTCDRVNGFCTFGCIEGWIGDLCSTKAGESGTEEESSGSSVMVYIFVFLLLLLLILAVLYYLKKKAEKKGNAENEGGEGDEGVKGEEGEEGEGNVEGEGDQGEGIEHATEDQGESTVATSAQNLHNP